MNALISLFCSKLNKLYGLCCPIRTKVFSNIRQHAILYCVYQAYCYTVSKKKWISFDHLKTSFQVYSNSFRLTRMLKNSSPVKRSCRFVRPWLLCCNSEQNFTYNFLEFLYGLLNSGPWHSSRKTCTSTASEDKVYSGWLFYKQ